MSLHHVDSGHTQPNRPEDSAAAALPLRSHRSRRGNVIVWDSSPISLLALAGVLHSQGYECVCARDSAAAIEAPKMGPQEMLVCDVGDDAPGVLETLQQIRGIAGNEQLPAILIADARWAGLELKTKAMSPATRCLFKPIDPHVLIAVVDQALWMPTLVSAHQRRQSRPSQPGWVTL